MFKIQCQRISTILFTFLHIDSVRSCEHINNTNSDTKIKHFKRKI